MKFFDRMHGAYIHQRRVRILNQHLIPLIPPNATILDVGCGDGLLVQSLQQARPDISGCGLEVLIRPQTAIPVSTFDGLHFPTQDNAFDAVMFVDVLHHCQDILGLLSEAKRTAKQVILIKDHLLTGFAARPVLSFMDRMANAQHGFDIPCNYLHPQEWHALFYQAGLELVTWKTSLGLYPAPFDWIFGRSLHVIAALRPLSSR